MRGGQEAPPPCASPAPDLHGSRRTRSRPSSPFASSPHSNDGTPRIYVAGASSPMESPGCSGSPGRLTRLLHRAARSCVRKELQPALDTFCTATAPSRLEPAGSSDARPEPPHPYFAAAVQALPLGTGPTQWVTMAPPLRVNDDADQMFNYSRIHRIDTKSDVLDQPVIAKEEAILGEADYMFYRCEVLDRLVLWFSIL